MEKASKAIRRSGVRLKSMGSGHRDLKLVISELREVRTAAKGFMVAQQTATHELLKWSMSDENHIIQDTFTQFAELNALWTEVQKDFSEHLKDFTHQFEMILEGEQHIDQSRSHLATCEQRELKLKKDLKKLSKKATTDEIQQLESKLVQAEKSKDLAQIQVLDQTRENEAVKLIRMKEGLLKLSESYLELAHKCQVIYEAQREIAYEIPDVHDKNIHDIRYTGSEAAKQSVNNAREQVRRYQRRSHHILPCAPMPDDPPPPYSPTFHEHSESYNLEYLQVSQHMGSASVDNISRANESHRYSSSFYSPPSGRSSENFSFQTCANPSTNNPFDTSSLHYRYSNAGIPNGVNSDSNLSAGQ